ncbi:MAG: hypothetical protein QXO16_06995 [Archaeoglobaceae archaeon]
MSKVRLFLPADSTFLSSVIYEGLLYLISKHSKAFSLTEIDFEDDFLSKAFANLEDGRIDGIKVAMAGNDNINSKIFEKLGLNLQSRKTFSDLLKLLKGSSDVIKVSGDIEISQRFSKKTVLIDLKRKEDGISAPQIFKVDRYTGFSSLESELTSEQLTLYISKEIALIALLGIYSAFVIAVAQQQQRNYYFLFFSPDEVLRLLSSGKRDLVKTLMNVKDNARKMLNEIISKHYSNELLVAEVALNVEIRNLLEKENLDKISLLLFKISPEGQRQIYAYKIYEVTPIEFFKETKFEALSKYFGDSERLIKSLREIVSPQSVVLEALSSMGKKNRYAEAENVLVAINGLYRFVVLGDADGFHEFTQKISEAIRKLENSNNPRERNRAKEYRRIIAKLS